MSDYEMLMVVLTIIAIIFNIRKKVTAIPQ